MRMTVAAANGAGFPSMSAQRLWFSLSAERSWHGLALVPGDEGVPVLPVARDMAHLAAVETIGPVTLVDATGSPVAGDAKGSPVQPYRTTVFGDASDETLLGELLPKLRLWQREAVDTNGLLILAVGSIVTRAAFVPLIRAVDAGLLCVALGSTRFANSRSTVDQIGSGHILGTAVIEGE